MRALEKLLSALDEAHWQIHVAPASLAKLAVEIEGARRLVIPRKLGIDFFDRVEVHLCAYRDWMRNERDGCDDDGLKSEWQLSIVEVERSIDDMRHARENMVAFIEGLIEGFVGEKKDGHPA